MSDETREIPLIYRLIDGEVREWLDRKFAVLLETVPPDQRAIVEKTRHVSLDGYYYELTPRLVDVLRRAGLLRDAS